MNDTKELEKKIENKVEKAIEPIIGGIMTLIFYFLINRYYKEINFLTTDFETILPLYNMSLIVSIIMQGLRILINNKYFKELTEIVTNIFFVIIAYKFWTIYPFDTSVIGNQQTWDIIFKICIIFPPTATTIATIVNIVKLFVDLESLGKKK